MADNTEKYPLNIQKLFATKPPLIYIPPRDYAPENRKTHSVSSISSWKSSIDKYITEELPSLEHSQSDNTTTIDQKLTKATKVKQLKENALKRKKMNQDNFHRQLREWETPSLSLNNQDHLMRDPYRTVFIARLDYKLTEKDINEAFVKYGPIELIRIVRDIKTNKSKGYGFIVYERDNDAQNCVEDLAKSGLKLESANRPILVDIERGRVVRFWKPTRLGGGIGGRNYTKPTTANRLFPNASAAASGRRLNISNNDSSFRHSNGSSSYSASHSHSHSHSNSHSHTHSQSGIYPRSSSNNPPPPSNSYVPRGSTAITNSHAPNGSESYAPITSSYMSSSTATSTYAPVSRSTFNGSGSNRVPATTAAPSAAAKYGSYVSVPKKSDSTTTEDKTVKDKYAKYAKYASSSASKGSDSSASHSNSARSGDARSVRSIRQG